MQYIVVAHLPRDGVDRTPWLACEWQIHQRRRDAEARGREWARIFRHVAVYPCDERATYRFDVGVAS